MSKIKNSGLDQYGTGPFEQQQFGTAGVEGVNPRNGNRREPRRGVGGQESAFSSAPSVATSQRQSAPEGLDTSE